jgi:tetratricopeptide (TPR) repeat protein
MVQESIITLSISQALDLAGRTFQYYVMQDETLLVNSQSLSAEESKEVREISRRYAALFEHGRRPQMKVEEQTSTGKRLFNLWLASSWKKVKIPSGARRILVIASGVPDILNLPWELLIMPGGKHLGVNPNFSIRRLPKSEGSLPKFEGELRPRPLRLLFTACSPTDVPILDYELEEESLLKAIGNLDAACDFGDLGSFEEFQERLADFQPHIVHLTGHGVVGKRCLNCGKFNDPEGDKCHYCSASLEGVKPQGHFLFEDESGLEDPRSSEELGQILAGSGTQCAFISGCQTGMAPAVEALGGICQGLVSQEVPLVIGWAASIADDLAIKFARIFYHRLASNLTIDRALYEARNDIWNDCKDRGDPSWVLPVLYSATTQSQIFDTKLPRDEPPRESKHLLKPLPGIEGYASHFVGRRREQQRILPKLRNGELQIVILTGLGGCGKSALETRLARKLEAEGFILIPISSSENNPLNAIKILEACIVAFREGARMYSGLKENAKAGMMESAALGLMNSQVPAEVRLHDVVSVLNSGKFLLVLDNFESNMNKERRKILSSEISSFYQYLLKNLSGDSRAIITSRYLPSDQATLPTTIKEVPLGDFGKASFIKILRRDPKVEERYRKGELELNLFHELHRTFGGTPRFLNQILDLLRNMNPQDLRQDPANVKLPSGKDKGELWKAQEEYFQAIFTPTLYGYLGPESQKALSRAAVYGVPVNLDGLAAVTGEPQEKLSHFARDWQNRAFAYPDSERETEELWMVYGLLRVWLLGRLSLEDRKTAHRAAGDFLRDLESQDKEGDLGLSWVDCLQEARAQYLQSGDYEQARKVTNRISKYFLKQGLYDSLKRLNLEMLNYEIHPSAMNWIGRSFLGRSEFKEASGWYQKALNAAEDNPDESALAQNGLNTIDLMQGRYNEANENFLTLRGIYREIGDRAGEVASLFSLAVIDLREGRNDEAKESFLKTLEISKDIGYREGEAASLFNLATIDLRESEFDEAKKKFLKSLGIYQERGDLVGEALVLYSLATIDSREGRHDKAKESFLKTLEISQRMGDKSGEAASLHQLGFIAYEQRKQKEGVSLVALSYLIANSIGIAEAKTTRKNLSGMANDLGYSQEQFDVLLKEVAESYQEDKGMALLKAAFEKGGSTDQL